MSVDVDTARPLRRPNDLVQLVQAIHRALPEDEAEWLEWKGTLPLDAVEGWYSISRQILGFANRHPTRAARFVGGLGYLVVGVEPGQLSGVTPVDVVQLDGWVRPYVGDAGPIWAPTYVTEKGQHVLVVAVEAPRWGDPIHLLRKTYQPAKGKGASEGTVFVRGLAGTAPATARDMDLLQERLLAAARAPALDLAIGVRGEPPALPPVDLSQQARERWIAERREVLMRPLGAPRPTEEPAAYSSRSLLGAWTERDRRTPDAYTQEVEDHLAGCAKPLCTASVAKVASMESSTVKLAVTNPSDRNVPAVEVTLRVPGPALAFDEEEDEDVMPEPPRPYGTPPPGQGYGGLGLGYTSLLTPRVPPVSLPSPRLHIDNGEVVTLTFLVGDVRPRGTVELEPFSLVTAAAPGSVLTCAWTATSTGIDGVQQGVLELSIGDTALAPLDLIPPNDDAS